MRLIAVMPIDSLLFFASPTLALVNTVGGDYDLEVSIVDVGYF